MLAVILPSPTTALICIKFLIFRPYGLVVITDAFEALEISNTDDPRGDRYDYRDKLDTEQGIRSRIPIVPMLQINCEKLNMRRVRVSIFLPRGLGFFLHVE